MSLRDEWACLAHGYRVGARIVLAERNDVLKVPLTALFRDGTEWAVFVDESGRAKLTHVKLVESNGIEAEVTGPARPRGTQRQIFLENALLLGNVELVERSC